MICKIDFYRKFRQLRGEISLPLQLMEGIDENRKPFLFLHQVQSDERGVIIFYEHPNIKEEARLVLDRLSAPLFNALGELQLLNGSCWSYISLSRAKYLLEIRVYGYPRSENLDVPDKILVWDVDKKKFRNSS